MKLTGIFNIPEASAAIVKVIFADISIITSYFQSLRFNPKFFCRSKSMYFTRSRYANDFSLVLSGLKLSGKNPKQM
jgi:hypothetical protein